MGVAVEAMDGPLLTSAADSDEYDRLRAMPQGTRAGRYARQPQRPGGAIGYGAIDKRPGSVAMMVRRSDEIRDDRCFAEDQ